MCCFFTFADLGPANVEKTLKVNEIAFSESFSFNWSKLFHRIEPFYLFWKNNFDGLSRCFNRLQESVSKPLRKTLKSDPLTREKRDPKEHTDIAVLQPCKIGGT